jgi:hypothetical protein
MADEDMHKDLQSNDDNDLDVYEHTMFSVDSFPYQRYQSLRRMV